MATLIIDTGSGPEQRLEIRKESISIGASAGNDVVLRVPDGEEPDRETLKRAAAVAAWYSKARDGGLTPVSATQAKHVSKPHGAKPGTVTIRREIVLKVRPALPEPEPAPGAPPMAVR